MAARAEIAVGQIVRTGLVAQAGTTGIIPSGHKFANDGNTYIRVTKTTTSGDITIQTPKTLLGLALAELVVNIGSGATKLIGPFPTNVFNQSDGMVYIDYESAEETEFTVEIYSI